MNSGYLHFPEFDPVIFSIGPVALHWYGLMYLVGFVFAMWLAGRRASRPAAAGRRTKWKTAVRWLPRRLPGRPHRLRPVL
ncbi:prolipoprotein diacylglyceryl transferase family protein [Shigella flexneri]